MTNRSELLENRRPAGVPKTAVFAPGPKGGWWQLCTPPSVPTTKVSCKIYNWGGGVLYDELFVATDGKLVDRHEVEIDPSANHIGSSWIYLKDGRILVPTSRATELREFFSRPAIQ